MRSENFNWSFKSPGPLPAVTVYRLCEMINVDPGARATLNSHRSQPLKTTSSRRIAPKVIHYASDEVMKVFRVE